MRNEIAALTAVTLNVDNAGIDNDGGIPMFVAAEGRYDAALAWGTEKSCINLWKAGNTDGGPIARTAPAARTGLFLSILPCRPATPQEYPIP